MAGGGKVTTVSPPGMLVGNREAGFKTNLTESERQNVKPAVSVFNKFPRYTEVG